MKMKTTYRLVLLFGWIISVLQVEAQTTRFQQSLRGGLAIATNGLNRSGQNTFVNSLGTARMSSTSDLVLPPGSEIVKAILYVEGYANKINQVQFSYPGSGGLLTFTPASPGFLGNPYNGSFSQFIVDVSSLVPVDGYTSTLVAGGNPVPEGRYGVAEISPYDGGNWGYGWSLFVAYTNPNSPVRNVTIADVNTNFGLTASTTLIIPNVIVPAIGPINAIVATTGSWGDAGALYNDQVAFGETGTLLTNLSDPVTGNINDILNSTVGFSVPNNVTDDGITGMVTGNYVGRTPYNVFGGPGNSAMYYDCDLMDASGILTPNPNPITIEIVQSGTGSDALGVGTYGVSVDIAAAVLSKSLNPTVIGDGGVATYTFTVDNNIPGSINQKNISFVDNLPISLRIANPSCAAISGGTGGVVTANVGTQTVTLNNLDLIAGNTATITVCVTNMPGKFNPDCSANPPGFTNGFLNISGTSQNLANGVTDQCLRVVKPEAGFKSDSICLGFITQFTDTSIVPNPLLILSYEWDFGYDPLNPSLGTANIANPSFEFITPGDHNVRLVVHFDNGTTDTIIQVAHVKPLPALTISPDVEICDGDTVGVTAGGGETFLWSGGPISDATIAAPEIFPTTTSTYNVTVTNSITLCKKDSFLVATVNPKPVVSVSGPNEVCLGDVVSLTGSGGETFEWLPSNETSQGVSFTPLSDTLVSFIGTTALGCSDTIPFNIIVETPPEAGLGGSDVVCNSGDPLDLEGYHTGGSPGGEWKVQQGSGTLVGTNYTPGTGEDDMVAHYIVDGIKVCEPDSAEVSILFLEIPDIKLGDIPDLCEGETIDIPFQITGGGNPFELVIREDGTNLKFTGLGSSGVFSLSPQINSTYTLVEIISSSNPPCSRILDTPLKFNFKTAPKIAVDSIVCETGALNYKVHLSFLQGDVGSYELNGNIDVSGLGVYVSNPIASGSPYDFSIQDQFGCTPVDSVSGIQACGCPTYSGSMDSNFPLNYCINESVTGVHLEDEVLAANDVLSYALHDNSGSVLGNVIAISSVPLFYFDSTKMMLGQTYYISAIAGLPDGTGLVDISNPNGCLSVSPGIALIFRPLPEVNFLPLKTQVCPNDEALWTFQVLKGTPDLDVRFQNGMSWFTATDFQDTVGFSTGVDSALYISTIEDSFGCLNVYSPALELRPTLLDTVVPSNVQITCNAQNTEYTVQFQLSKGDPSSYAVTGNVGGNFISANQYESAFVQSGGGYQFFASDANNCKQVLIDGSHLCPCDSKVGKLEEGGRIIPLTFCVESGISLNIMDADNNGIADGYYGDGNDTLSYLLLANLGDTALSPPPFLNMNSTPDFNYNAVTMQYNRTYYIVPVAGDMNPTSQLVQFGVACEDYGEAVPIQWVRPAEVSMTTLADICFGNQVEVQFNVVSDSPLHFRYSGPSGVMDLDFPSGTSSIFESGLSPGDYVFSIDSLNTPIVDENQPIGCKGKWVGAPQSTHVIPTPEVSFLGDGNFDICQLETLNLGVSVNGEGNVTAQINGLPGFIGLQGSFPNEFPVSPDSTTTYQISMVESTSPLGTVCPGSSIKHTSIVNVNELPSLTKFEFSKDEICVGDQVILEIEVDGAVPEFTIEGTENGAPYTNQSVAGLFDDRTFSPNSLVIIGINRITDGTVSDVSGTGCTSNFNEVITLLVNPLPTADLLLEGNAKICAGDEAKLRVILTGKSPFNFSVEENYTAAAVNISLIGFDTALVKQPLGNSQYAVSQLVDANGCAGIDLGSSIDITVYPIPDIFFSVSDTTGCIPFSFTVQYSKPTNFVGICEWDMGDGLPPVQSCDSFIHTYNEPGSYPIKVKLVSEIGCENDSVSVPQIAHPKPLVDFDFSNTSPNFGNTEVVLENQTVFGAVFQWQVSGVGVFDEENPTVTFPNVRGVYEVQQRATSVFGCTDSLTKSIRVSDLLVVHIPNAFTPDGDNLNEVFRPIMAGYTPESYSMEIFDRWGNLLFETKDPDVGWDGKFKGSLVEVGLYGVIIKVASIENAEKEKFMGKISLLR